MRQKLTLTEERNRMLNLINFNYDQHSHDNLSTTLIKESTNQFWTEESATLFNEEEEEYEDDEKDYYNIGLCPYCNHYHDLDNECTEEFEY